VRAALLDHLSLAARCCSSGIRSSAGRRCAQTSPGTEAGCRIALRRFSMNIRLSIDDEDDEVLEDEEFDEDAEVDEDDEDADDEDEEEEETWQVVAS
jgi:hypothetical protein